jgi:hypothetical protein
MPAYTAEKLITRAAALADMRDGFIPTATWLDWLNDERVALTIFMARHGWPYGATLSSTVMTGATSTITIGGAIAIMGVWERDSSGRYRHLTRRDSIAQFAQVDTGPVTGAAAYWDTRDSSPEVIDSVGIHLYPRPTSGTYVVAYLPALTDSELLTDSFTYPMRFERRIVLGMALNALTAEESDTTKIERLIAKMEQYIEEACWDRAMAETPYVRNVDLANRGWTNWILYPPPVNWYWV